MEVIETEEDLRRARKAHIPTPEEEESGLWLSPVKVRASCGHIVTVQGEDAGYALQYPCSKCEMSQSMVIEPLEHLDPERLKTVSEELKEYVENGIRWDEIQAMIDEDFVKRMRRGEL